MSYQTVLMDPPWHERGAGQCKRGADKHYPILKTPDILQTILDCEHWSQVSSPSHLYMWVTNNHLQDGLWLMGQLSFRYITNIVWIKQSPGLGRYFRGQHELLLFGVRGRGFQIRTDSNSISSVIQADRRRHSQKPEERYELIESRSNGPYLELFSRQERAGWTSWGNQVQPITGQIALL